MSRVPVPVDRGGVLQVPDRVGLDFQRRLERWLERAIVASSLAEVLDEPS